MSDTFWLARGICSCGRPVARRAAGPGTHEVRCNVCHAVTAHVAAEARLGTTSVEPVAPSTTPPPLAPRTAHRGRAPLAIALALLVLAGGGTAAYLWRAGAASDESPAATTDTSSTTASEAPLLDWWMLDQRVALSWGEANVTFTIETEAYDKNKTPLDVARVADVPTWWFVAHPDLVDPFSLDGWAGCDSRECAFTTEVGPFVYFTKGSLAPALPLFAFDTASRSLFQHRPISGEWQPIDDWETHLANLRSVRAEATPIEEADSFTLMVEFKAETESFISFRLQMEQDGETILDKAKDTSFLMADWTQVGRSSVELRLLDAEGAVAAAKTVVPTECGTWQTIVQAHITADGSLSFGEITCV